MVKVYEIVSDETLKKLYPKAQEAVELIEKFNIGKGKKGDTRFYLHSSKRWKEAGEVAAPLIRYVHSYMFRNAKMKSGIPQPYTHVWNGRISKVINMASGGFLSTLEAASLSQNVISVLRRYQLANSYDKRSTWYLRGWPSSLSKIEVVSSKLAFSLTEKDEWQLEKRSKEEAEKHPAVVVHFDISTIPLPTPDPKSVLEYVGKLVCSYNKMKDKFEKQQKELLEVSDERDSLKRGMEKLAASGGSWLDVVEKIQAMVAEPEEIMDHREDHI